MGVKDLFITPIYLILFTIIAYFIRPYVTNDETRKYFLPGLWVRFAGAIALGLIYQFYYDGGDTFNYFTHGSRWIWDAFLDDPKAGLNLMFESGGTQKIGETYQYSQHIWYYRDSSSFLVVRIVSFFDLFTFHTYLATALFFATFSFSGLWAFFSAVTRKYPDSNKWFAIAVLFVPSTILWGSGILKDTVTLAALGWLTWACIQIIEFENRNALRWVVALASVYLIFSIKVYIVICFIPMIFLWLYWKNIIAIRSIFVRVMIAPALLIIFGGIGFGVLQQISNESEKYSLDAISERAAITSYDIRYGWGARTGGDGGYDLGVLDGTWQSMVLLMPEAINVSLFRPYLWEVLNPLMLLSALESIVILGLTIWLTVRGKLKNIYNDPYLIFCLGFSLLFAFAVGVSTFNFGTLMRYKIPMMPFYVCALSILHSKRKLT